MQCDICDFHGQVELREMIAEQGEIDRLCLFRFNIAPKCFCYILLLCHVSRVVLLDSRKFSILLLWLRQVTMYNIYKAHKKKKENPVKS